MATKTGENAVDLLLRQHQEIRQLFDEVEKGRGERRREKFDELRSLLAVHETAEEEIIHPYARNKVGADAAVDDLLTEERTGKDVLKRLEGIDPSSSEFMPLFRELRQKVEAHAEHEERTEFPKIRSKGTEDELQGMAKLLKAAEAIAPTRPHPGTESVKKNLLVGPAAAVMDRTRDAIKKARRH